MEEQHSFCHPSRRLFRFTLLVFMSALTFGSYFNYDVIGAIANSLSKELNISDATIGSMYTMYSIAAIPIVFIGGLLIDWLGIRKSSLIFSTLVFLGALINAISQNIVVLYIGRFVFGAGAEALVVAQMAMLTKWFKGRELALAFGISLTVSRLGTLFTFNTGELIAKSFGSYKYSLYAATILCALSLASNIVYNMMDIYGEGRANVQGTGAGSDKVVVKDIKQFGANYWFVTIMCLTFYSAIFPFTSLSTKFFAEKWGIPKVETIEGSFLYQVFYNITHMFNTAGGVTSIITFASMVCAPFAGHLVDKIGKRATLMLFGSLLMIPCHLAMGLTMINPIYFMSLLGAAFVLVPAAMWPAIPLVVPKDKVGTAFGLTTAIQNFGLALFPFLNGLLRDNMGTYTASQIMFASLGLIAFIFAILLKRSDRKENDVLEKP